MIGVGYLCFGADLVSYIERFVHNSCSWMDNVALSCSTWPAIPLQIMYRFFHR